MGEEASPSGVRGRILALDALRGVAVLGILLINIVGLGAIWGAESYPGHDAGPALGWGLWDRITWWVSQLCVEGTMRGLFTLLFGASFVLFCAREVTSSGRADVGVLYLRRSALLVALGVFHALVLFWTGDILILYGMAAFALFPFRRTGVRGLLFAAAAILAVTTSLAVADALQERADLLASTEAVKFLPGTAIVDRLDSEAWAAEIATRRSGLVVNVVYFWHEFVDCLFALETIWWVLDALGLMFVGAALLHLRVITGERDRRFYARLALAGYASGLALNALEARAVLEAGFAATLVWPEATYQASRLAVTLGHMGLILWLLKSGRGARTFELLARTGRMALTNYLLQSAIAAVLFSGFGLGLYGAFDRPRLWGIAAVIWVFQVALSWWWLERFRMGPAEWVWRGLTYGKAPALRREARPPG